MRAEFPLLETCVYLNSNSAGATPRGAKAALDEYWRTIERWRDEAWEGWLDDMRAHADELAARIACAADAGVLTQADAADARSFAGDAELAMLGLEA